MNAIANLGGVIVSVATGIFAGNSANKELWGYNTVTIAVGIGPNNTDPVSCAGAVPAIALWNDQGERLGQYMPGKNEMIKPGLTSGAISIDVPNGVSGDPTYTLLTTVNDNAICITSVSIGGNNALNWIWLGDVGFTCQADWYPSTASFGDDHYQPKCTWIDSDHTDGLRFVAMSMHMGDFNSDAGLVDEYNTWPDNLCDSKARFMMWGQLVTNPGEDTIPPFFSPPLSYNANGSDVDFAALFTPGTVNNPDPDPPSPSIPPVASILPLPTILPFVNRTPYVNEPPKLDRGCKHGKGSKHDKGSEHDEDCDDFKPGTKVPRSNGKMDGSVNRPQHVVISDHKAHDAAEVCGSETSRGPSFVSTHNSAYCDISTKTTHPVCSSTVTTGCFDIATQQLFGQSSLHARDLQARDVLKQYTTHERWTPSQ